MSKSKTYKIRIIIIHSIAIISIAISSKFLMDAYLINKRIHEQLGIPNYISKSEGYAIALYHEIKATETTYQINYEEDINLALNEPESIYNEQIKVLNDLLPTNLEEDIHIDEYDIEKMKKHAKKMKLSWGWEVFNNKRSEIAKSLIYLKVDKGYISNNLSDKVTIFQAYSPVTPNTIYAFTVITWKPTRYRTNQEIYLRGLWKVKYTKEQLEMIRNYIDIK